MNGSDRTTPNDNAAIPQISKLSPRTPRIALALTVPVLQQGGVEVLVRTLIANQASLGDIYLISSDHPDDLERSGLMMQLTGHFRWPEGDYDPSITRGLISWLEDNEIGICHFHLLGTYNWNARSWDNCPIVGVANAGFPCLTTNHQVSSIFDCVGPQRPIWEKLLALSVFWWGKARQLASVSNEITVSRHDLAKVRQWYPFPPGRITQRYHSRLDEKMPVNEAPDSRQILNVATIAFRKGQHILAEAFASIASEFPSWSLHLVGMPTESACVEKVREIVASHGLEERIIIHQPQPDPSEFFRRCEIYVQPSLIEGLGLSLQEAMFHGRACIGSDTGGIPELIESNNCGVLFKSGDVTSLASELRLLINSPERRRIIGRNARTSILSREMTCQRMIEWHRDFYLKLTETDSGEKVGI